MHTGTEMCFRTGLGWRQTAAKVSPTSAVLDGGEDLGMRTLGLSLVVDKASGLAPSCLSFSFLFHNVKMIIIVMISEL